MSRARRVAIIGSFRQYYAAVKEAIRLFREAGWEVTSPAGTEILEPGIDFVRFESDPSHRTDPEVQSATLVNIFAADLTYVVAPEGYVGRTTCYEIGRLVQARKPVFFSEAPRDLPIVVAPKFVASPAEVVDFFAGGGAPQWLFAEATGTVGDLERKLVDGSVPHDPS